jgi:hypothetical protein
MVVRGYLLSTVLALTLGAVWGAPALATTNLVTNAGFDTTRNGWTDPGPSGNIVTTAWNRDDARGTATSGSFAITNSNAAGANSANGPAQCVAVTPGARYDAGAKIEVPGGQTLTGHGDVVLYFNTSTNCSSGYLEPPIFLPSVSAPGGRFTSVALRDITAPATARSVLVWLLVFKNPAVAGSFTAQFDDVFFGAAGGCVPSSTVLCLDGGRFAVSATFAAPGEADANAQAIALTDDTGYLWFFSANNVEVTMKVLNACSVNGFHWVFVSGLTNVKVSMTVKDMQAGTTRTYANPQGQFFQPQFDTSAFACP